MYKGVKQIPYFVILLAVLLLISKTISNRNIEKKILYDFDFITINLEEDASEVALNVFNDFSNHFLDVYIDSTDVYNIQNVLKITNSENLQFQYDLLKCENFNELFAFIDTYLSNEDLFDNLNHLSTINHFIGTIKKFLLSNDWSGDVGHEVLLSLITGYTSNNSLKNRKIILKVHRNANYSDIYTLLNDFNNRISSIDYLTVNNKEMLDDFILCNQSNDNKLKIILDEYYIAMSNSLDDLLKISDLIKVDSGFVKIKNISDYINDNTIVRGERFKVIRTFPIHSNENHHEKYLNKNDFLNYLNNFIYELSQTSDDFNIKFDLNMLKNELILNISQLYNIVADNDLDMYYLFIQDDYISKRLEYVNNFCNIEPLTIDYLNSSIKKEFHNDKSNVFISKVYLIDKSKKHKKYIHSLFNENTTIFK
tara:strand:+ start:151 stop:1422 length:1272 start_codon:yes stop_codon:yes gene_type:complete